MLGNVSDGIAGTKALVDRFNEVCAAFAELDADFDALLTEQAELQDKIDAAGAWDLERTFEIAMDALNLPPGDMDVTKLSGGERRRVALCRLLLSKPDLLLLDEPTNHLDAESVAWLERTLQEYPGTVVAVTHDRYFLDNVAGWILELDRGAGIPWQGNYTSWLEQKQARLAAEDKADRSRREALARELEWIRMAPKARQAKGKARISAYNELVAEAEAAERRPDKLEITIPPGPRLGDRVVEADRLVKGFGERLLIDDLSFLLPPGGIVGVIGPNGAGKTTLFRMIVGEDKADSGTLQLGSTVELAWVDQSREGLDPEATVFDEITGGVERIVVGNRELHARAYVSSFGFRGSDQQKKVGELSGGERNRVQLAKVLKSGGTCSCSTSRPTTSTWTPYAPSKKPSWASPAAQLSSATIAGSSTGSRPTSLLSRASRSCAFSRGTSATTKPIVIAASAPTPTSRTGCVTSRSRASDVAVPCARALVMKLHRYRVVGSLSSQP